MTRRFKKHEIAWVFRVPAKGVSNALESMLTRWRGWRHHRNHLPSLPVHVQTHGLSSALQELTLWAGESADRARKIRDAFFCGTQLCPGIVSIEQGPASDTGDLILRVDLSHWGRELMRALITGDGHDEIVEK